VDESEKNDPARACSLGKSVRVGSRGRRGSFHGRLVTAVSHNGGLSWTETFPHFSVCAGGTPANGGNYDRASDPWVSFGGDGTAYQVSLSFNANDATNAVLASRSTDFGNTWSEPFTIIRDSGDRDSSFAFNDKESVTADPATAGYAYAVWDRFVTPGPTSRASIEGYFNSRSFREPIWFSRTTDGGLTWEPARNIYDRSAFNGTIGSQILVASNGDLLDFFDEFFVHKNSDKQRGESISVIRSTDKGVTWSKASTVVAPSREIGAFDPDTLRPIRAEGRIPEVAIDRASGALYAGTTTRARAFPPTTGSSTATRIARHPRAGAVRATSRVRSTSSRRRRPAGRSGTSSV
jgi:predicted heme/steroid binding protein